jgi:energy-coupling factor transporter ATP-binding protein EcfA2
MATVDKLTPGRIIGSARIEKVGNKNPSLNILVYGQSGTGKTTLCGSADDVPEMRSVIIVDLEGGTESLRTNYGNVDTIRVKSWAEMQQVYDELHQGNHKYKTVVIDSLTECAKFNMYTIMDELVSRKVDEGKVVDPDIPSVREWGKNIEQMRKFVRAFRDLPMHTIFTCLERVDKDDKTGAQTIKPMLSGKLADEVSAFLDVVMYYYVKETVVEGGENELKRVLLTRKTAKHTAKDRTGKLPMVIVDPDMQTIYNIMYPTVAQ